MTQDSLLELNSGITEEDRAKLLEHLPEGQQTPEGLLQNMTSPQLKQAMDALTTAMRQNPENVEMILMMCELDPSFLQRS